MAFEKGLKGIFQALASTQLAIGLFLTLCLLAIPGTFTESRAIYSHPVFIALLALLGINTLLCTVRRWKSLPKSVLIVHCGLILTLMGCVISSFGFVATVNVYEGGTSDRFYRWDIQQDVPLDFVLAVKKIHREFYPIPLKVGILKGTEKFRLVTVPTGGSFDLEGYLVQVGELEMPGEYLKLTIAKNGQVLGSADTAGATSMPPDFPYGFKLVAYQNPVLKRIWVDLALLRNGQPLTKGTSEVNNPFSWQDLDFFNTQTGSDPDGRPFAGIQIVKDPGRPFVFTGMFIVSLGGVLAFARRKVWKRTGNDPQA